MMNNQRRILLKGSLTAAALGVAVGAGLLVPGRVLAAWPEKAFKAKAMPEMLQELMGAESAEESGDIKIKAPDIAENGAVVPVTVTTSIAGAESIALIAVNNPAPLVASYELGEGAEGFVSTRIKMGKSGDVVAVVKSGGQTLQRQERGESHDRRLRWVSPKNWSGGPIFWANARQGRRAGIEPYMDVCRHRMPPRDRCFIVSSPVDQFFGRTPGYATEQDDRI